MNITLDGPGGSGKSTIAKLVAKKMGISYLDTGAMYRAMGYYALSKGIAVDDEKAVLEMIKNVEMKLWQENGVQQVSVNGINVTPYIREHEISMAASTISKIPAVRIKLVELQRKIASDCDCIMDGRDCGSFVLPQADYKFYLTASSDVRAQRRQKELVEKGQILDFETIKADIEARDKQDMTREFAPLVIPEGATVIDTSDMTIDQVCSVVMNAVCR
ncbi:MAG: (d)CMP kinase [Clostridia bacterium]|nr:(d)CMP kinase [Clostridia bacterium]